MSACINSFWLLWLRIVIKYACHNLYLSSKAGHVMSSFPQQHSWAHPTPSRHELAKLVLPRAPPHPSLPPLTSVSPHEKLVEGVVSDLLEDCTTPAPPRPNHRSHGSIWCSSDAVIPPALTWINDVGSIFLVEAPQGLKKPHSKPGFDRARVCRGSISRTIPLHGYHRCDLRRWKDQSVKEILKTAELASL